MINSQAKQGYKHTPLGWIPEEWGVFEFSNLTIKSNEKIDPQKLESSTFCIELEHISQGTGEILGFVESKEQKSIKNIFVKDDILFGKLRPYLRKYWLADRRGVCSSEIWVLKANEQYCIPRFLFLLVQTHNFIQFANVSSGSKMPRADWDYTSSFPCALPPLPEQKAIAKVLSTWDEAISKTQELITQKELRKKWLNKKLFNFENFNKTGKTEIVSFENHFKIIRSYAAPRDSLTKNAGVDSVYCIHYGDIHAFYANEFLDFAKQENIPVLLNEVSIDKEDLLRNGDIIMADASEDIEGVAELVEVTNIGKKKATGGLHTIVFRQRSKKFIPRYIAYLFNTNCIRNELRKKSTGTSVYSIGKSTLNQLKFLAHTETETQIKIVKILEAADKEIELLKTKLESLNEQKKGLMQVLLSGKKRIRTK